jgi:hypothetical protein
MNAAQFASADWAALFKEAALTFTSQPDVAPAVDFAHPKAPRLRHGVSLPTRKNHGRIKMQMSNFGLAAEGSCDLPRSRE